MTRTEFLQQLEQELQKRGVSDAEDIVEEYREHFAFKLADGYSQEEIAAKLGSPLTVAAQYEPGEKSGKAGGSAALTVMGLAVADLGFGILAVLLAAWAVVMAALVVSFGVTAVCLVLYPVDLYPAVSLPSMPYASALLLGLAMAALTVVCYVGCVYCFALVRQLFRAYGRFHRNRMAAAKGRPVLPPVAAYPQFTPARRRRLRTALVVAVIAFGALFVAGMAVSMLTAGAVEFWHAWGWFGYGA